MEIEDRIITRLPRAAADAYRRCLRGEARPVDDLEAAVATYLDRLRSESRELEFLDLGTAEQVAEGCRALLRRCRKSADPAVHRAVQAAVEYFVLADDAEDDASIVGFDDDLVVVQVTAEILGPEGA